MAGRYRDRVMAATAIAALAALCGGLPGAATHAATSGAREAFLRGDYAAAEADWKPAADKDDPEAELGMGEVYEQGKGDYSQAERWYEKAAAKDNGDAEYRLALIAAAGNVTTPPDYVKAYKWALIAAAHDDNWGAHAKDLKRLLDAAVTAGEKVEAEKQADDWQKWRQGLREARQDTGRPVNGIVTALAGPPLPSTAGGSGCPGWPWPNIPCRSSLPPIPGTAPLAAPPVTTAPAQAAVAAPPRAPPPEAPPPTLDDILQKVDCASLHQVAAARGQATVVGTVPDDGERAKLEQAVSRLPAAARPVVRVVVMPAPLCRSLVEFDSMRQVGLVQETGLDVHVPGGDTPLHEGDHENIEIKGGERPLYLRIDYFTLEGQVLHMLPTQEDRDGKLGAGEALTHGFVVGGAPFGTEFVAVTATPRKLDLGRHQDVEPAAGYLERLEKALHATQSGSAPAGTVITRLVRTEARP